MKNPFFYSLPPAGYKIPLPTIIRSFKESLNPSNNALVESIRNVLGIHHLNILYLSSGRAALWLILKAMSKIEPKKVEVVLPAYTCPAIVSAILKAGLKPILCDNNLDDFGLKIENLKLKINKNTLAIVVVHLFGYPANIDKVKECCRGHRVFVIEDAAQAFGNSMLDSFENKLGSIGDAGFFSFGRGKPISILHGGILVTKLDEIFSKAKDIYSNFENGLRFNSLKYWLLLGSYKIFSSPYLYWIPLNMPFLHLGETIFEPEFRASQGLESAASLIMEMIGSIEEEKAIRKSNSIWYSSNLESTDAIQKPKNNDFPYLRYPIFVKERKLRDQVLGKLIFHGTGATGFYPFPLNELSGLKELLKDSNRYPNAKKVSDSLITLPVHSSVTNFHREKIVKLINDSVY